MFSTFTCRRQHWLRTDRSSPHAKFLSTKTRARASAGRNYLQEEDRLKQELLDLEEERDTALVRGKAAAAKVLRLTEAAQQLLRQAELLVGAGDIAAARAHLEDKALVQDALAKAQERSAANMELALRLDTYIGKKESPATQAQPERDIDEAFLDLERSSLERLLHLDSQPGPSRSPEEPERPRTAPHTLNEANMPPAPTKDDTIPPESSTAGSLMPAISSAAHTDAADLPPWWQAGRRHVQQQRLRDSQNPALQALTEAQTSAAAGNLGKLLLRMSDLGRRRERDAIAALHYDRIAHSRTSASGRVLNPDGQLEANMRDLAKACLTSMANDEGLREHKAGEVQHSYWADRQLDKPLTPERAQGVVVELAELLQIAPWDASRCVAWVLGEQLAEEMAKEALHAEQTTASTVEPHWSATSLSSIRKWLSAFAPQLASKDLGRVQQCLEEEHRRRSISMRARKQLSLAYAKADPDPALSSTRVLNAILRLDALD
ncbi:hypothetical protein WJX73_005804 [Symbiochloris irregularis]|uniref:Uncharacterized protein n=1 Tax=Symbiochloris irregularis TaxID=706552 RepID=A0AAW1PBC5_9CHLO